MPLEPALDRGSVSLERAEINLHNSAVSAYRMGEPYDAWFSARLGYPVALVYMGGDQRPPVLGTFSPTSRPSRPPRRPRQQVHSDPWPLRLPRRPAPPPGSGGLPIRLGDRIDVTATADERPIWDWPMKPAGQPQYDYGTH